MHIPTTGIAATDNIDIPKELPNFLTYPSTVLNTSNGTKLMWAYKYTDIDNALENSQIYYKVNGSIYGTNNISVSDNFQTFPISLDYAGSYGLYTKVRLLKANQAEDYELTTQEFDKLLQVPTGISYVINLGTNRLMLSIADYDLYQSFFEKVTNFKITFTANNKTREFNNVEFDYTGTTVIDLSELEDFINENVEVNLYAYYDSGIIGFDTEAKALDIYTPNFALKQATSDLTRGEYYIVRGNSLQNKATAWNSIFSFSVNKSPLQNGYYSFNLKNDNDFNNSYYLKLDEGGFKFIENNENIHFYPSQIALTKLTSENNFFTFTGLVPGVSLKKDGKYLIDVGIDNAYVTATVSSASNTIQDNKIYFEVYETDENMIEANSNLIYTKEVNISDLTEPVVLDNLRPSAYYFFKIKANVIDNGNVSYMSLYDIDNKTNVINYPISTLSNLSLLNQSFTFSATSYDNKYLTYNYTLENTKNIDHISYTLYTVSTSNGKKIYTPLDDTYNITISDDVNITTNMSKKISIPPASGFKTDINYAVGLKAYLKKSNNTLYELDTIYSNTYYFGQLSAPYFYIQALRDTSKNTLTFKVNPIDSSYTLVKGQYSVGFYDEEGTEIPNSYDGIYTGGKDFVLNNIDLTKKSKIVVTYKANVTNTSNEDNIVVIYATTNLNDKSKINLTFSNSVRLSDIRAIRYSIYKDGVVVASPSGLEAFSPTANVCGTSTCYGYTLKSIIAGTGIYYIQIQFIDASGQTVDERTISYAYTI